MQAAVVEEVEAGASRKVFDLRLGELGPYNIDFSRSGRYMLAGGKRGHLGLMDWQSGHTFCEVQVCSYAAATPCSMQTHKHAHSHHFMRSRQCVFL